MHQTEFPCLFVPNSSPCQDPGVSSSLLQPSIPVFISCTQQPNTDRRKQSKAGLFVLPSQFLTHTFPISVLTPAPKDTYHLTVSFLDSRVTEGTAQRVALQKSIYTPSLQ